MGRVAWGLKKVAGRLDDTWEESDMLHEKTSMKERQRCCSICIVHIGPSQVIVAVMWAGFGCKAKFSVLLFDKVNKGSFLE
jgi:hypothetical protein